MISIIIPLYNKEHCIKETLLSVLSQSYGDFELIVVNDGSKDSSVNVVNSINDNRVRLINKGNEGVSKTRNRGIKEAKGEWVLFLDADDLMCEGCLQAFVKLSEQYPQANILSGNFITRKDNQERDSSSIKSNCLIPNPYELLWKKKWHFRLGSFLAKREILPLFNENITNGEDFLFFVALEKNGIIAHTPETTMVYITDNSELSKKVLPIEKYLSWNIKFNNADSYLKSIYVDLIIKNIIVHTIRYKKVSYSLRLLIRHFKPLVQYTPLYIYRSLFKR